MLIDIKNSNIKNFVGWNKKNENFWSLQRCKDFTVRKEKKIQNKSMKNALCVKKQKNQQNLKFNGY